MIRMLVSMVLVLSLATPVFASKVDEYENDIPKSHSEKILMFYREHHRYVAPEVPVKEHQAKPE